MGQLVSDVTDVLNYQKNKKSSNNKRQEILQQIAKDESAKTNLIKKAQNMVHPVSVHPAPHLARY